jgi:hypothetical protein
MRIAKLKLLLAVIVGSTVLMLGGGTAAAGEPVTCPSDSTLHLHRIPKVELVLSDTAPTGNVPNFIDSPALRRPGEAISPYTDIAEWDKGHIGGGIFNGCRLLDLSPLHVWLGLRNGDDQGTNFDFRADVSFTSPAPGAPTILIASVEKLCIRGLTPNPASASEETMALPLIATPFSVGDLSLTLSARIASPECGGHVSATGLRVYFDSADRDSRFDVSYGRTAPVLTWQPLATGPRISPSIGASALSNP